MLPKYMHRPAVFLALAMLCFAPLAQAGTHGTAKVSQKAVTARHPGALQAFWRGLAQMFEKEGAGIDPTGRSGSGLETGTTGTDDEGAGIDPTGIPHG